MSRLPATTTPAPGVARPVSRPNDTAEREADRVADIVSAGGHVRGWSLASSPAARATDPGTVQRDNGDKEDKKGEDPNAKEYKEAAKKTGEALLETDAGKALKKQVLESPEVKKLKEVATTPAGIAIGATAVAGGLTGLALAGKELPFQPPAIPLDRITPGLSAQINLEGPLNAPTAVGLTITFKPKKETKKAAKPTPPLRPLRSSAEEQRLSEEAIDYAVRQMTARTPLGIPVMKLDLSPQTGEERPDESAAPVQRSPAAGASRSQPGEKRPPAGVDVDDALSAPGRPLTPHVRRAMEARFGHDFSAIRLHDDSRSRAAADRVDSRAFTVGDHIVAGPGEDVEASPRLLAHELTHAVQQRNGAPPDVQRYTAFSKHDQDSGASLGWQHPAGGDLRVADDGHLAVEDNGWGEATNKRAWTTRDLVADANATLAGQGSQAELRAVPGAPPMNGRSPVDDSGRELIQIEPYRPSGGRFNLASDCGTAARQVMGSGPREIDAGTGGAVVGGIVGAVGLGLAGAGIGFLAGGPIGAAIGAAIGGIAGLVGGIFAGRAIDREVEPGTRDVAALSGPDATSETYLSARGYHGGNPTTPEEWSEELFRREFGATTRAEAYAAYAALSPAERDAFDRRHGINRYATPRVGQGLTVSTEKDMPGFAPTSNFTWNFHYAATVLVSGHDYVTIENAAGWDEYDGWIFYLYGPASKGQSFHEEQGATQTHGSRYTTFVVQPEANLEATTRRDATLDTAGGPVTLPAGTRVRVTERGQGDDAIDLVTVIGGAHAGTVGRIGRADLR